MGRKSLYLTYVNSKDFPSTAEFFSKIKEFISEYERDYGHLNNLIFEAHLRTCSDDDIKED